MRRLLLTTLFAAYYMVLPFVLNCGGKDLPYLVENEDTAAGQPNANQTALENCQAQEFLTADCVDVITRAGETITAEEGVIRDGWEQWNAFEGCAENFVVGNCQTTIQEFLDAYQICLSNSQAAKNQSAYCTDIKESVDDAAELCDTNSSSVAEEFCAELG